MTTRTPASEALDRADEHDRIAEHIAVFADEHRARAAWFAGRADEHRTQASLLRRSTRGAA